MKKLALITALISLSCLIFGQTVDNPALTASQDYDYLLMEAARLKNTDNLNKAVELFLRCTEIRPEAPTPYAQLSDIMITMGQARPALDYARKAVEYGGENQLYLLALAKAYQMSSKPDSSLMIYERLSDLYPDNTGLKMAQVSLNFDLKNYDKVIELLDTLQARNGFSTELVMSKLEAYTLKGDTLLATDYLKGVTAIAPGNPVYVGALAELYANSKDEENALATYELMSERFPDFAGGTLSMISFCLSTDRIDKAIEMSERLISNKNLDFAPKWELLVGLSSNPVFEYEKTDDFYRMIDSVKVQFPDKSDLKILKTDMDMRKGRYPEAKASLLEMTSTIKDNYLLWGQLGFVLNATEDYTQLQPSMEEAVKFFPDKTVLYLYKAIAENRLDKPQEAVKTLKGALNYLGNGKEEQAEIYGFLADAYNSLKDYVSSDEFYLLALDLDPKNENLMNNYAYHLSLRGENLPDARRLIDKCLEIAGENPTYLDTAAWVYYKSGDKEKALEYMERTISASSGQGISTEVYAHYIEILVACDRGEEAEKIFNRLKKDPKFKSSSSYQTTKNLLKNGL